MYANEWMNEWYVRTHTFFIIIHIINSRVHDTQTHPGDERERERERER